jgi:glucan phosphoethanolaminetransferase (alkaline phosphatase superfamily)
MDEKIIWSFVFVLIVMLLCIVKPDTGRIFLGIFYLIMAIGINVVNAFTNPESTIQMGEASFFVLYRNFFSDVVSRAPVLFILMVALFEIIMGLLILNKNKNVKLGLIGTSIFLILITPFGYIQLPWLGLAGIQLYLVRKDFGKTFPEIIGSALRNNLK